MASSFFNSLKFPATDAELNKFDQLRVHELTQCYIDTQIAIDNLTKNDTYSADKYYTLQERLAQCHWMIAFKINYPTIKLCKLSEIERLQIYRKCGLEPA
jgi:hypothetical protein